MNLYDENRFIYYIQISFQYLLQNELNIEYITSDILKDILIIYICGFPCMN